VKRRLFLTLLLAAWVPLAVAQTLPKPGAKDLCAVCGMLVSKYPNWVAMVTWKDGHTHFFDGAKDMFKFLHDLPKYAPNHRKEDIAGIFVTDFYNLERIDARKALFVVGSDALGPMGHEFVPLASKLDADDFMKDHKGKKILPFERITASMANALDNGRFE
jgi:nitrous oxide reductase accessory protein NosL